MFGRGRSFILNFKNTPLNQRREFADNARKKLQEMPTPEQPFWEKLNRAVPVGEIISEYVISFTRNFLITIARRLGAVHGQRSAENIMDKFAGEESQKDKKEQPSNPGPEKGGPSKPGPANEVPTDGLGQRHDLHIFPWLSIHTAAPNSTHQHQNPGPSTPETIQISYNDRNRARFLEYFIGLQLEDYSMLDIIKLSENEFRVYQASKLSYQ
jgi:hypothetical protein